MVFRLKKYRTVFKWTSPKTGTVIKDNLQLTRQKINEKEQRFSKTFHRILIKQLNMTQFNSKINSSIKKRTKELGDTQL